MSKHLQVFIHWSLFAISLIASAGTASAQQAPSEPSVAYQIQAGDKLLLLARDILNNPADWNEVARLNRLPNPNQIRPGQVINIPYRLMKTPTIGARVVSAEGSVQLAGAAATAGSTVAATPGMAVPEGSRLQTGANSSAVVELADGSRIKLLPNTLADVVTSRGYATRDPAASGSTTWFSGLIRLAQGALEAAAVKSSRRTTPLQVETPTSLVGVRGTQFRVAYEDPAARNARTEVTEGIVRADNPAQASGANLPRGTGAVVNPAQKEVKVVKLLAAPDLAPLPADVLKPPGSWPLPALSSLAGATGWRVQVAADEPFNGIVRDLKTSGAAIDLSTLANGGWFVRVRGFDSQGLEGFDAVKRIVVRDAPPPPPPPRWRVTSSAMALQGGQAVLSWNPVQADGQPLTAAGYRATLARDAALAQVIAQPDGTAERLALGPLQPGVYFIELRTTGEPAQRSELFRFELPGNWGSTVTDLVFPLQRVNP